MARRRSYRRSSGSTSTLMKTLVGLAGYKFLGKPLLDAAASKLNIGNPALVRTGAALGIKMFVKQPIVQDVANAALIIEGSQLLDGLNIGGLSIGTASVQSAAVASSDAWRV